MADIVTRGKIIIDLEKGKVDIPAPDMGPVLAAKDKQIAKEQELGDWIARELEAEAKLAKEREAAAAKAEEAARKLAEETERNTLLVAKGNVEALQGLTQMGDGFFLLGRSAALFASNTDEGLQQMIRTLATVQAGFDLFKGTIQTFQGAVAIIEKLTEARKAQAALTATATAAEGAHAAAMTTSTGAAIGLTAAMTPLIATFAAIAAIIAAAAIAYKLFMDAEAEEAEQTRKILAEREQADQQRAQAAVANIQRDRAAAQARLANLAAVQTAEEQLAEIEKRKQDAQTGASVGSRSFSALDRDQAAQYAVDKQQELIDLEQRQYDIRQKIADETTRANQEAARAIEQQQRSLENAQKQLDLENKKVQSFEAQFGQLSRIEQERLKTIGAKVEAGQDLSRFEENELRRIGGEAGQRIANDIAGERGKGAGADDVLRQLGGLAGLRDATAAVGKEQAGLDELTGGVSADAAIKQLESKNKALADQMEKLYETTRENIEKFQGLMDAAATKQNELATAAIAGG